MSLLNQDFSVTDIIHVTEKSKIFEYCIYLSKFLSEATTVPEGLQTLKNVGRLYQKNFF